jgi:hypothetical protein
MASAIRLSTALRNAILDVITTTLDAGTAAVIQIYDGTQPAGPGTAITSQVLLATLTMNATSFGAAAAGTSTANAITSDTTADNTGTATWARISTQSGGTAHIDCSVGTSGCDINLSTVAITAGSTVAITSLTFTEPAS